MNINPLISIITISYNSKKYIEQCINSVIYQEYSSYEYIIIDGGSKDGTVDVIKKYSNKLSYWHSLPDRGMSHAFNLGLEQTNGSWIIFLNSDDFFINKSALSNIEPYLLSSSNYDVVHGMINIIQRHHDEEIIYKNIGADWKWGIFRKRSTIPHPAAFTNRNLYNEVGLYDENYRNALDYELYLRKGKYLKVKYAPVVLTNMRDEGISKITPRRSLKESRNAIIKNNALPFLLAHLNYFINLSKLTGSNCLKKIKIRLFV